MSQIAKNTDSKRMTPWGQAHGAYLYHEKNGVEQIVFYYTAGHGGYYVSDDMLGQLPDNFKNFRTFTGKPNWFEEDCDAAIVLASFPLVFGLDRAEQGRQALERYESLTKYYSERGAKL